MQSKSESIPFNDLSRTPRETMTAIEDAVARVLASGWFVMGPNHAAFEEELGAYLEVPGVVLLGNGTDALEIGLASLGVTASDSVLTVANAGAYSTIAARQLGATVVYADVDPATLLMTPATFLEALDRLDSTPKVVVVTHLFGAMAEVTEITRLAHDRGILVLEDCAQSLGARVDGRQSGTIGDLATTSFYPTKNLGALGDGGAIYTSTPELADRAKRMRQYGWESKYRIEHDHGRNSRLDEMQAAILRVKLPLLDRWNERRREIHSRYELASNPSAHVVGSSSDSFTAHLAAVVSDDRDAARAALLEAGVSTDIHYPVPDHQQRFPTNPPAAVSLPATERAASTVFSIPMFPELTDDEVSRIAGALEQLGG